MVAAPSALPSGSELSSYDPATRTVTLGRVNVESDQGYSGAALFGCVWAPEVHATGNGFRSYFQFNITDAGDGFAFAAVDGDVNNTYVCGAGEQHLGYSGNNSYTAPILFPKIGLEIDTRLNFQSNPPFVPDGFNPARRTTSGPLAFRTLANGRADPDYAGGHIGLVYWGGETPISTSDGIINTCTVNTDCLSPSMLRCRHLQAEAGGRRQRAWPASHTAHRSAPTAQPGTSAASDCCWHLADGTTLTATLPTLRRGQTRSQPEFRASQSAHSHACRGATRLCRA